MAGAAVRCGLFGGTFDPIHRGHMALVRYLKEALALDEVVLMPTFVPPHKLRGELAAAEHRLAMCRLAAAECPGVTVSDWEIRQGGASFTVNTLEALHADRPEAEWFLFVGADMFESLATWFRFRDLTALCTFCTVPRDGVGAEQLTATARELEGLGARCIVVDMLPYDCSSTDIRRRRAAGESVAHLVPAGVEDYMNAHHLYEKPAAAALDEAQIVEILRVRLKPGRFAHSLAVAEEAERLARRYGADPAKARTAGLLHDIMKNTNPKDQLQILAEFGILMSELEKGAEKLYHAMSGAAFIQHVLGVEDADILDAVRYHTTARAGMSTLEKVLYLADFTSADRDYDDVDVMRRLVDVGMEDAMLYALKYTIRDLVKKEKPIHPDTVAAFNEVLLKREPT